MQNTLVTFASLVRAKKNEKKKDPKNHNKHTKIIILHIYTQLRPHLKNEHAKQMKKSSKQFFFPYLCHRFNYLKLSSDNAI